MSHLLWKHYLDDDVEKFRRVLGISSHQSQHPSKGLSATAAGYGNPTSYGTSMGSPGTFGTSPKSVMKTRKVSGQANTSAAKGTVTVGRAEVNSRDYAGLTLLHRASSSTSENAISFALALIEHPAIDLYAQDTESGWTALHRALYYGNATVARAIIDRDRRDPNGPGGSASTRAGSSVIKVKDHEGNSPFDVYNATIAKRALQHEKEREESDDSSQDTDSVVDQVVDKSTEQVLVNGDEVFCWGSSKNYSLGLGDQDDRQYPEKIALKRPDHLLFRMYREYMESLKGSGDLSQDQKPTPKSVNDLPALIVNRPIIIQDVALSKLHSAIVTTDPESNLHMCGFGPGGRLGTGDEVTRFSYVCIDEGALAEKKVVAVALGQNHTLAVSSEGDIMSWGMNGYGQLGYALPRPASKDEEPICTVPRQIFGPLKREIIIGVAASALHSIAHTSTSLFAWGKNEGQLGLMDSDSRSLDIQPIPRRVAVSLFKAPILMVSAINAATICLLANHTVCVFTNYGYNIVKFPLQEGFTNYHLRSAALTTRYDAATNHISSITAGGDTIAAISSRGDLFVVNVRKIETNPTSTSTTNPSKIKGALSQPQRIWSLRKGNWDGIRSVSVAENGSVVVCTQAGAVWRRVKRAKIKDSYVGSGELSKKDFKFQRIPGLTKVSAVRSTPFGVYAAIRKDCDISRTQIQVDDRALWDDVAPLLCIRDLEASQPPNDENNETSRYWTSVLPKDHFNPLKFAVLTSPDLEADVQRCLLHAMRDDSYDVHIGISASETFIPVHGFMLGRSPVLRRALHQSHLSGSSSLPDIFEVDTNRHGQTRIILQGLDFITIVNLVIYLYTDTVVDCWHFTRQCPQMAYRFRQVRVELMKTAGHLKLQRLESAVRQMTEPEHRMDLDLAAAIRDPIFFEDGDTIIELDGDEIMVHSVLLRQRCSFFEGLFNGRAGGQWLTGRRQENDKFVRVDLKHILPETFFFVKNYLYADIGTELFDEVVSADIDEFSELVMDVMSVANELMLDRLSQICQQVIGRFVTTRNVSQLLNTVAPCSVVEFKDAALEYVCLQLESMLENHLIDDLDEDLMLELDEVVRANQLNCLPFAKSGRAELLLHERHPSLAGDIDEERQRRVRDMTFRANLKDDDSRLSTSHRARFGSLEDIVGGSPSQDKARRKSKAAARNAPFSPNIRPKDSTIDLMFDMEDDELLTPGSSMSPTPRPSPGLSPAQTSSTPPKTRWDDLEQPLLNESQPPRPENHVGSEMSNRIQTPPSTSTPKSWSAPIIQPTKLDMKKIMAQASSSRTSNLSMSISAQKAREEAGDKATPPKLSQKERKRQQQASQPLRSTEEKATPSSPWQIASAGQKTSLKDVFKESKSSPSVPPAKAFASPVQSLPITPKRTASPDTRFAGQARNNSVASNKTQSFFAGPSTATSRQYLQPGKQSPLAPHSKSYSAAPEPTLQLSMADIIGQQTREQEVIKEAVAKRSLMEIQEEQAFQEWWDQESRRAIEEEEFAKGKAKAGKDGLAGRGNGDRTEGGKAHSSRPSGERGKIGPGKPGPGGRGKGKGRGDGKGERGRGRGRGISTSG